MSRNLIYDRIPKRDTSTKEMSWGERRDDLMEAIVLDGL